MNARHQRSWRRRLVVSVLVPLLVLVGLVVAAVLFITATPWGTHLALSRALEEYNQVIPGQITVDNFSGTILFGPSMEQVAIVDKNGDPTVTVSELNLEIDPFALTSGLVRVASLTIRDGKVYLRNIDGNSSFGDVAPTSDDPEDEPDPAAEEEDLPAAPKLPFALRVDRLRITNTALFSVPDDNPGALDTIARVEQLTLSCRWLAGDATAHITEIKGSVPPAEITVTDANLGATLRDARFSHLNDGHIVTNRGTLQLKAAAYDIAASEGQALLGVTTNTNQLEDFVPSLEANRSISLDLQVAMLSEVVELSGSGRTGSANLELQGAVGFVPALYGNLDFDLQQIQGALFVAGVRGDLSGSGKAQFHTAPDGNVDGALAFSGQARTGSPIGHVTVDLEATRSGGNSAAAVRAQSNHGRLSVSAEVTTNSDLTLQWKARVSDLEPFVGALSLPDTTGAITSTGSCRGTVDAPKCAAWLNVNRLATAGMTLHTLKGKGVLSLHKGRLVAHGRAELRELTLAGWSLREANLEVTDTDLGFHLVVDAMETEDQTADLAAEVIVGPPTSVTITKVQSRLANVAVVLESPLEIQLKKRSVSIAGGPLLVGEGKLWLRGNASLRGQQNLTLKLQEMDLALVSRLTVGPNLGGLVDGKVEIGGTATRPRLGLNFRSGPLTVDGKPLAPLQLAGSIENNLAKITALVGSPEVPLASFYLAVPVRVNLQTTRFIWLKNSPHTFSWDIKDLDSRQLADWLPDDSIVFDVTASGELTFSANTAEGQATLHGSMGYEDSKPMPFSGSAQFSSTVQKLHLEIPGLEGNPFFAEMDLKISIPELLKNRFDMGPSSVVATLGKTSLNAECIYHGASHFDIRGEFSKIDLAYLNILLDNPNLTFGGIGDASGRITFLRGETDVQMKARVKGLTLSNQTIGNLSLSSRWYEDRLTASIDLQDKSRSVFELTASVPFLNHPRPNQDRWQPDQKHSLKWSVDQFELADLALVLGLPAEFAGTVSGEGVVSGNVDELFGYTTLDTTAHYSDLPPLRIVIDGEFQTPWQRVKAELKTQQGQTGLLDIRYDGNLGKIFRGEQKAEQAPLEVRFDVEDFNLQQINPFSPAGLYDVAGAASANVRVKGSLADPEVEGKIILENAEVAVSGIYEPFTGINTTLKFSDKDMSVDAFQFDSGAGTATVDAKGIIRSWNSYELSAGMAAQKLGLGIAGLPPTKLDTKIDVDLRRAGNAVQIDLRIGKTLVELEDWIKTAVKPAPTNPNVVLVEREDQSPGKPERDETVVTLSINSSEPLRLTGSLLDTTWEVHLTATTGRGQTQIDGKANVVSGSFQILGNDFSIEEADLIFDETAGGEPFLKVIATTDFPDTEVKATVRGRVSNPELTLTSIPSMSEADIYSLLLVGSTDMDASGGQSANLLMGVASMKAPIMKQALRKAGISQFSVGEAREGEGQVMTIGARLRPDLVMQITVNLNAKEGENESELRFVYDISKTWKFETGVGPAYSSIDVFWHVPLRPETSKKWPAAAKDAKQD